MQSMFTLSLLLSVCQGYAFFKEIGEAVGGVVEGTTYVAGEVVEDVGHVVKPIEPITEGTGEAVKGTGRAVGGGTRVVTGGEYESELGRKEKREYKAKQDKRRKKRAARDEE